MSNLEAKIKEDTVAMVREEIRNDPAFVIELAEMVGLPSKDDLQAMETARLQAEQGQDTAIQGVIDALNQEIEDRNDADNELQQSINNIQLIPGPKGDAGATGAQGIQGSQGVKGDKGDTGATGPAGTNATTTAIATTSANGLMSKEDKAKLDKLRIIDTAFGVAPIPLILAGATVDVTIPFSPALTTTSYFPNYGFIAGAINLSNLSVLSTKTKNLSSVVVTLKNNGLLAIAVGASIEVEANQYA